MSSLQYVYNKWLEADVHTHHGQRTVLHFILTVRCAEVSKTMRKA